MTDCMRRVIGQLPGLVRGLFGSVYKTRQFYDSLRCRRLNGTAGGVRTGAGATPVLSRPSRHKPFRRDIAARWSPPPPSLNATFMAFFIFRLPVGEPALLYT